MATKRVRKLTPKQKKFIELETKRILNGGKGSRVQSYRDAGYNFKGKSIHQEAYRLAHTGLVGEALESFSTVLLEAAPAKKVAKTIAEDIFQTKNSRARSVARQQWLKATGNEGPTTLKIKTAWTRLKDFYEEEDDQPSEGEGSDRVSALPGPGKGNQLPG